MKLVVDVTQRDESTAPKVQSDVIDRLYEVAIDPARYETLLDRWEELIGPQRAAANQSDAPPLDLREYVGHFNRADQVLDRFINDSPSDSPKAMVSRIDRTAAFAVDTHQRVIAINTAAAATLGVTEGARLDQVALGPGEAEELARQAARLIHGNSGEPILVRVRSARLDHVVVVHLRLVHPEGLAPYVIALTSEFGWSDGFDGILRGAFDLTEAELEVLRALTEGQSVADVAHSRDRSPETVRAQVKAVMSKTETRSQTELVRLTLSMMDLTQISEKIIARLPSGSDAFPTLEPRPFQTMFVKDGRRFDYLILGDPAGRPVLFLPLDYGLVRWPGPAEAEAARRGIKVIVPVRPGYGASTPLPKGTPYLAQISDDLAALLDHLGAGRVPIISLGGDSHIGIALHAAYPERVTALIACAGVLPNTRPEHYERMDKWHRFILASARYTPHLLPFMVKAGFALARRIGKRGFIHAVYGNSPADVGTFEIPDVFEAMVCGSEVSLSDTHSAHDAFAREVISHETSDWSNEIAQLKGSIPVHFLNGLQDPQVRPATLDDFRRDYDWIDFRIYPDAGQLLFFLKWRDVIALVETYLPDRRPL